MRTAAWLVVGALLVACRSTPSGPDLRRDVAGSAFIDRNRDGVQQRQERLLGDGDVFVNGEHRARMVGGRFVLPRAARGDIVSLSVGETLEPGPRWAVVGDGPIAIGVAPLRDGASETRFVVAADTHAGIAEMPAADQPLGLRVAAAQSPTPAFLAVTGDLTQANQPEQFEMITAGLRGLDVAYVPVPGNHDWYDGGATYRRVFGPPTYDFVVGPLHVVVLNDADSLASRVAFLDRVLGRRDLVVALMHAPPDPPLIEALESRGVDALMTGHIHANRTTRHGDLVEHNTEPLLMGGMDLTPAGYRVVDVVDGALRVAHRTTPGAPAPDASGSRALRARWTVAVDGAVPTAAPVVAGGRVFVSRSDLASDSAGGVVAFDAASGALVWTASTGVSVRGSVAVAGDAIVALDQSARLWCFDAATGGVRWTVALAESVPPKLRVAYASPLVVGDTVFAGVGRDFAALDARTGAVRWRRDLRSAAKDAWASHFASSASPIVVGGDIVALFDRRGQLFALDRETGATRWASEPDLAPGAHGSPVLVGGEIVVVDEQARVVRVDPATGKRLGRTRAVAGGFPWALGVGARPAVFSETIVVATRWGDLVAWRRGATSPTWRARSSPGRVRATHYRGVHAAFGAPIIAGDQVVVGGADGILRAFDRTTGAPRSATDLGAAVLAAPALANRTLYAVTTTGLLSALELE